MQLSDSSTNTKVTYLFVRDFEWQDVAHRETHAGHPKKGYTYRGVLNTDSNTWRLFYVHENQLNGIYLSSLKVEPEEEVYKEYLCDIIEITRRNILELQLLESQLDAITNWSKDNNKRVRDFMGIQPAAGPVTPAPQRQTFTPDQAKAFLAHQEQVQDFAELAKFLGEIANGDPAVYTALSEFIYSLGDRPERDSIDTSWPQQSQILGAGTNISKAIKHLALYGGDSRKTNLDTKDLLEAMKALLEELVRRQFHQQ